MILQTDNYNNLKPPSNPKYPWVGKGWQVLCYYCNEPIRLTLPYAGYRQREIYNWEHLDGSYNCKKENIRPDNEIDDPRCSCGTQEKDKHNSCCSSAGKPNFHATSMNRKEEELRRIFGTTPSGPTRLTEPTKKDIVEIKKDKYHNIQAIIRCVITMIFSYLCLLLVSKVTLTIASAPSINHISPYWTLNIASILFLGCLILFNRDKKNGK